MVRVIERLVGNEAVDLRGFDPGIVEASLDAFEMKRMRAGLRSLTDFSFTDTDNGVPAANMSPMDSSEQMTVKTYGS